jgi:hypothetical protein
LNSQHAWPGRKALESDKMLDLVFIAISIVFFVIAIAYTVACEKLKGGGNEL